MTNEAGSQLLQEPPSKQTNHKLDTATSSFLECFSQVFASIAHLPIAQQRATIKELFHIPEEQLESVEKVADKQIPGRHGPIKIRLFTPRNEGRLPLIIYFHRGGWVYGSLAESETICRRLANQAGAVVAAVEYRLSPEHKFPIPLEDCYDATRWLVENAAAIQADPAKVILCGESAGGNLAAAVALMGLQANEFSIAGQLLLYPILSSDLHQKHYDESPDKSLLSYQNMQFFWSMYLASPADGENPFASPLKNERLCGLPATLIVTAEHDALKHEGAGYHKLLQQAGVNAEIKNYAGVIHGFLDLPLAEGTKQRAMQDIADWLKRFA